VLGLQTALLVLHGLSSVRLKQDWLKASTESILNWRITYSHMMYWNQWALLDQQNHTNILTHPYEIKHNNKLFKPVTLQVGRLVHVASALQEEGISPTKWYPTLHRTSTILPYFIFWLDTLLCLIVIGLQSEILREILISDVTIFLVWSVLNLQQIHNTPLYYAPCTNIRYCTLLKYKIINLL